MHTRLFVSPLVLVLILIIFSGCVKAPQFETSVSPTLTISLPTAQERTQANPIAPITTPTPKPTLASPQIEALLSKLLSEPVDCAAPCFWGITPEKTTENEAIAIFDHFNLPIFFSQDNKGDHLSVEYDFSDDISLLVILGVKQGLVKEIKVRIIENRYQGVFPRKWQAYSPDFLIERYGQPSKVTFFGGYGPNNTFMALNMTFDEVDLMVEYFGDDIIPTLSGTSNVCLLTAEYQVIDLYMGVNTEKLPDMRGRVPLEEATSMDIGQFAHLMTDDPKNACFEIDGEALWNANGPPDG